MNLICTYRASPAPAQTVEPAQASYPAVLQEWEESERGWGVRPDGATLHLTLVDHEAYVAGYNKTYNSEDEVPESYTRVSGPARAVRVTPAAYAALVKGQLDTTRKHEWARRGVALEAGMIVMLRRGAPGGMR